MYVFCSIGCVHIQNTSFNIHGEPIVGTPEHAIDTFLRSGIHHLILGDWLISKKD